MFEDFIHDDELSALTACKRPEAGEVDDILARSAAKEPLSTVETAKLIAADDPASVEKIFATARQLKRDVYGNRIVIFAPLYIGNYCVNDCFYCAFRRSNQDAIRRTLSPQELQAQVESLIDKGHKRLILVFGEHPDYSPQMMARTVEQVYGIKKGHGEIRRVNINAAPLDHDGYKEVKAAGIGTYQIFQETYHHATYTQVHPADTQKGDYLWRLHGLSRAFEAGCDDMGIGALFGLYDWRFEVLAMIKHADWLQQRFGVGPHTVSFPRLRPAHGVQMPDTWMVKDHDFMRLIAILRLAIPYTGMILTAREKPEIRKEAIRFGVSQVDAGSRIELGGYTEAGDAQCMQKEQFSLGDMRSLDEVMRELMQEGNIPSFCTACYRVGRTGEHFMEYAIPGFIEEFCTPNAVFTLAEYLEDYASPETRKAGEQVIRKEIQKIPDLKIRSKTETLLKQIQDDSKRDIYF